MMQEDVWVWDFTGQTLTRVTTDLSRDSMPVWTSDGRRLAFASLRDGPWNIYWKAADGTGQAERLIEGPAAQFPMSWRSDSTGFLFLDGVTPAGGVSLLSVEDNGSSEPLLHTPGVVEGHADVSPDGNWLAYHSDASGRREVYVRPFPDVNGNRSQISQGGGTLPVWASDSRELFYLDSGGRVMVVAIEAGEAQENPQVVVEGQYANPGSIRNYDIAPDGQLLLMLKPLVQDGPPRSPDLIVVLDCCGGSRIRHLPCPILFPSWSAASRGGRTLSCTS